ncbi:MAG: CoA transferase, partial [Chloroflexi bacterium]|nr:CoA transferase [Chloroflexota bacterium]
MMAQALAHLRVIDLGVHISASYCTKLLADLGADVVKVEWGDGDPLRRTGTFPNDPHDPTVGGLFGYLNTNKRTIMVDLKGKKAVDAVLSLAAQADLIVENLGPGVLERMGIGFDHLRTANPRIALVRISDFGQNGPDAGIAATDFTVQAAGGWISKHFAGLPDPIQVGGNLADYVSAAYA